MAKLIVPRFDGLGIAVIGDGMWDCYVHGTIERISPEAPVPVFLEKHRERVVGGAANVAANIQALGGNPRLISKLESEWSVKTRYIVGGQQIFRSDVDHTEPAWHTAETIEDMLAGEQFVIVSDYAKGMVTEAVMDGVRASGLPFIVDPKRRDWSIYDGASCITPNAHEAMDMYKSTWKRGAVLVTMGAHGMSLGLGNESVDIPATVHEVADVTGAGDTVIATLGCCLAAGMDLVDAARVANAAAGVVVQKRGTAVCSRQELEAALV